MFSFPGDHCSDQLWAISPVCSHVVDTLTDIFRSILVEWKGRHVAVGGGEGGGGGERALSVGQKLLINAEMDFFFRQ